MRQGRWLCVVSILLALLLNGCHQAGRDKLLRVLFDGVPEPKKEERAVGAKPEKQKGKEAGPKIEQPPKSLLLFHEPFLEQLCDSCHDSKFSQKLIAEGKELCFTCHDDFTKDKKSVHYPAGEGLCLECHDPHQSEHKRLLKKPIPNLCYTCHDEGDIKGQPQHEGQDACLDCHDAHASNEEKLLK